MAAGFLLTAAEDQEFAETQVGREFRKGSVLDERCAQLAEIPFRRIGPGAKERLGDDEVQYRVAQEFQALVVAAGCTSVGQGLAEQPRIFESIV